MRSPFFEEIKRINFSEIDHEVGLFWKDEQIFEKSIAARADSPNFTFYEGPPTANGRPGIHHVLGRTIKDIFCRYKTLKGYRVDRKAGWDTHGLPVEIEVEKQLRLKNRTDIENYGIDNFNKQCKESVLKYKDEWDSLTEKIGYWVDLSNPYVTFDNNYIESVWWLLKNVYEKGLLYKGHKIQWYSPGSGTVLSSHEVSLGYKEVTDPSVYVKLKVIGQHDTYLLIWTTTPWTLCSNVAVVVNPAVKYVVVEENNEKYIIAKERAKELFLEPTISGEVKGEQMLGWGYEPLYKLDSQSYNKNCWKVYSANYVTVEEGTGIVHTAPAFGADDHQVAIENDLPVVNPVMNNGLFDNSAPLVSEKWFKEADPIIIKDLQARELLYKKIDYKHNYPFDWRKGTPLMSYPVESWFIKTTAIKERLVSLNNEINWQPNSVKQGRFGNWLENNIDWALSRKRFWGTPLPIWASEDGESVEVIGSVAELREKANINASTELDLHRPNIDRITWKNNQGMIMRRVPDVLDVWFDSGAMPFAQWHYPFENKEKFEKNFPADFICEGIDQTRGWFYTLHAIGALTTGNLTYRNVVVNGLVLDEKGEKMSKSKGNTLDPFQIVKQHGADVVRWYMVSNSAPWDDMKFSVNGLEETRGKVFGTLENIYRFFSAYANIDGFSGAEAEVLETQLSELDKWLLSRVNNTIEQVEASLNLYDCTNAVRTISKLIDDFSNWYIRRSRERFWAGKKNKKTDSLMQKEKLAAYQTTYTALKEIVILMSPVAPFFSDYLYKKLTKNQTYRHKSVHLEHFPSSKPALINLELEEKMEIARGVVQLSLLLRNREKINVRQPLRKILIVSTDKKKNRKVQEMSSIILEEINVKEIEFVDSSSKLVTRKAKADFKKLGPILGKKMKHVANAITEFTEEQINQLLSEGRIEIIIDNQPLSLASDQVIILSQSVEGLSVANDGPLTVALDKIIDQELASEGIAREFVNRVQSIRKARDYKLTDRITIFFSGSEKLRRAISDNSGFIEKETLSIGINEISPPEPPKDMFEIDNIPIHINIELKKS